jgi:hypothetical protein
MQKLLGIVLVAILSLGLNVSPAKAKVAAGATCSKIGATTSVGGKSLVCKKVGSKKLWTLSASSMTPTPSSTPKAAGFCADTPTAVGEITNYNACAVFLNAESALLARLKNSGHVAAPVKIIADPGIDSQWISAEKARVTDAYNFWLPDFKPESFTELYWLMNTKDQVAWANSIWLPLEGNTNGHASIDHLSPSSCNAADSADFGQVDWQTHTYTSHGYITNTCAGETTPDKAFKVIHEYTHLVQYSMNIVQNGPSWLAEGGADYFGEILGNAQVSQALVDAHHKMYVQWIPNVSSWSSQQWLTEAKSLENANADPHEAYYLGSLITELLVGVYGLDKYIAFMKSYSSAPNIFMGPERADGAFLPAQFQKVYGISLDDFYKDAYPYVHAMSKLYESN